MKTNGKLNSTALALAALILFISLLSSTAIAFTPAKLGGNCEREVYSISYYWICTPDRPFL